MKLILAFSGINSWPRVIILYKIHDLCVVSWFLSSAIYGSNETYKLFLTAFICTLIDELLQFWTVVI